MPEWMGHQYGAKILDKLFEWITELGIPNISLWAGSTENLTERSEKEIQELFKVYYLFLKRWEKKKSVFEKYQIRIKFVGDLNRLPPKMVQLMGKIMQKTAKYQRAVLNILIHYGGKFELTETMRKVAQKIIKIGHIEITEKDIEKNLMVPVPVDLIIRTGGMSRLSDFMLWQSAFAEMYTTKTLWPDFSKKELMKALRWFSKTKRNFGR